MEQKLGSSTDKKKINGGSESELMLSRTKAGAGHSLLCASTGMMGNVDVGSLCLVFIFLHLSPKAISVYIVGIKHFGFSPYEGLANYGSGRQTSLKKFVHLVLCS